MKKYISLGLSLCLFLGLISACAPNNGADLLQAATETAARQTVDALATRLAQKPTSTRTPVTPSPIPPTATRTNTPIPIKTNTPLPTVVTPWNTCDVASFISETISDKIVMDPGTGFIKTWTLANSGTCTWDKNYKIVFESGEAMTDILELNFLTGKKTVEPGQQVTISMNLISPLQSGNYLGFWALENDKGQHFGLGGEGNPVWVSITVGNPSMEIFKVSSVKAYAIPNNYHGSCRKGYIVTIMGKIKTNRSGVVTYNWRGTDGSASSKVETIVFYGADEQNVFHTFTITKGFHYGYSELNILTPNSLVSEKTIFSIECMN
jgi:hypothetical protein